MGADLYIEKLRPEAMGFEVSEHARENGYFRDCYNGGGLFSVMNATLDIPKENCLSWWRLADRKDLMKHGKMKPEKVKLWLAEMKPLVEKFCKADKLYWSDYNTNTGGYDRKELKDEEYDVMDDHYRAVLEMVDGKMRQKRAMSNHKKEYREWAEGLIKFMVLAIELKSNIIFSV